MTTRQSTLRDLPAFRLVAGDVIRHNNRRAVVTHVGRVVFYPRPGRRADEPARHGEPAHGVKLTLRIGDRGQHAYLTLENYDMVRAYR